MSGSVVPIEVFCSYAEKDESLFQELEVHLSVLQHQGFISIWHRQKMIPGANRSQVIDTQLERASVILPLVSPYFLASNSCYEVEMQRVIEQYEANVARVVPIILRPCDWTHTLFAGFQCLPQGDKSVTEWRNRDRAWYDVAVGIRRVIEELAQPFEEKRPVALSQVWNVPYLRNPHFTGRDELFRRLDRQLSPTLPDDPTGMRRAALTQPQAIKGLGGIGKTQIAVEFAYRSRDLNYYIHTLWVNAANEETLTASFTALAELLPEFPAKTEKDQRKLVNAIKRWLERCKQRWLLIFDNADDVSLMREYLPRQGNGSILLTTRASAVGSLATPIEVDMMGFVEGTHLLLRRAQRFEQASDEDINLAGNIVVALDHFPLALDQAGAYIEETKCSFADYLKVYQDHRKALLARRGMQSTDYPDSVATTWSLSFQKVAEANPAAAELLCLCAFLAPDRIPQELITDGSAYWTPRLQEATSDFLMFNQMLEELLKFSLVKRLADEHLLSIHRLVQAVQIDVIEQGEQRLWAERVIRAVNRGFPNDPQNTMTWSQ